MHKRGLIYSFILFICFAFLFSFESQNISNSSNSNTFNPDLVIGQSGDIHAVWAERDEYSCRLFYSKSADKGITWSPPTRVASTDSDTYPDINIDVNGNPHVVYQYTTPGQNIIYHTYSVDGGQTWMPLTDVSRSIGHNDGGQIKIDELNRIHVVWGSLGENSYWTIYYSFSDNSGSTWSLPLKISEENSLNFNPQINLDEFGNPHIVWVLEGYEHDPGRNSILYRYFDGINWSAVLTIASDYELKANPTFVIDSNGTAHFIWNQTRIKYRFFDGNNWSDTCDVAQDPHGGVGPRIAIDSNDNLVVVWDEFDSEWDGEKHVEPSKIYYTFNSGYWHEPNLIERGSHYWDHELKIENDSDDYTNLIWAKGCKTDFTRETYYMRFDPRPYIEVPIDIKPGTYPNSINLGSNGNIPVAIFTTAEFDATNVYPTTVSLAGAEVKMRGKGTTMSSIEDVNGDGLLDLIVHVDTTALELSEGDTEAILVGETYDGQKIRGTDTVRIVKE